MSRASQAGSWEVLATQHSCVFPAGAEPDPAIVRAVRDICPNYVPMLIAMEYRTPTGGVQVLHYHVLGSWQPYPTDTLSPVRVDRPTGFPFTGGVVYAQRPWSIPWEPGTWQHTCNVPDLPLPYDWDVLSFIRQVYWENRVPFGTRAQGDMHAIGRNQNSLDKSKQEAGEAELAKIHEDARLSLRDDKHQLSRAVSEAKADYEAGRNPWVRWSDATRPSIHIRTPPEPPVPASAPSEGVSNP